MMEMRVCIAEKSHIEEVETTILEMILKLNIFGGYVYLLIVANRSVFRGIFTNRRFATNSVSKKQHLFKKRVDRALLVVVHTKEDEKKTPAPIVRAGRMRIVPSH
jgi:hypothetical protein